MNENDIIYKSYDNVSQSKKSQVIQMKNKSKSFDNKLCEIKRSEREAHSFAIYISFSLII